MQSLMRGFAVVVLGVCAGLGVGFAAAPTEACTVLTPAQVSAALGSTVSEGTYIMPTFKKTRMWKIQAGEVAFKFAVYKKSLDLEQRKAIEIKLAQQVVAKF